MNVERVASKPVTRHFRIDIPEEEHKLLIALLENIYRNVSFIDLQRDHELQIYAANTDVYTLYGDLLRGLEGDPDG